MDLKKIFLEDSCPTKIGGQAVLEGIMMKGEEKMSVAVRLPDDSIHIKTENLVKKSKWTKYPIIRGVFIFAGSLVQGTKTLMYSAEVLENFEGQAGTAYEKDKMTIWLEKHFGVKGAWNVMLYFSVFLALVFTIGIFIIGPTALVDFAGKYVKNEIALNLIEGVLRILLFVVYIALISKMKDIKTVFRYHGAEHKCIHCYEKGLDLTVENCKPFYTLHPRCGTSFLMFVMVISLVLFSLLGWPNLLFRIMSRLLLLPVIAGLSYEVLRWAGRSSGTTVKILSLPGLYLQKLTTLEPDEKQLEVAIIAMKAAMEPASVPCYEGTYEGQRYVEPGSAAELKSGSEPGSESDCSTTGNEILTRPRRKTNEHNS
jgi:uncharacterized protein YqhQ